MYRMGQISEVNRDPAFTNYESWNNKNAPRPWTMTNEEKMA